MNTIKKISLSCLLTIGLLNPSYATATENIESENSNTTQNSEYSIIDNSINNFINLIKNTVSAICADNDLYPSVAIAQAILESDSGKSYLSQEPYYNLFGIKGTYKGQGVSLMTNEDYGDGNLYATDSTFRRYSSLKESLEDYATLLKDGLTYDPYFYKGVWVSETDSYKDATAFLTGRYASDIYYGEKLNWIIEEYNLDKYDDLKSEDLVESSNRSNNFIYPILNVNISSYFGERWGSFHRGVDFAADLNTPILASMAGTVIVSSHHYSWGNYVAIQHANGLVTLYAHNNSNSVIVGQVVEQGEVIGYVGSTGNSTGPHLHFEVNTSANLSQDTLMDPMEVLLEN